MTIESMIAKAVAAEINPQFEELGEALVELQSAVDSILEILGEENATEIVPEAPAIPAVPAVPTPTFVTDINNFGGGNWVKGILKIGDGYIVSIINSEDSRAAFVKHGFAQFSDGQVREIYWPQVNGTTISVHVKGEALLDGNVVGYPNKVVALATKADALPLTPPPAVVSNTPAAPQPSRKLDFDLKLMGINIAGAEFAPGTAHYHWPTREDFQLYKAEKMNMARIPFKWERIQPVLFGDLDAAEVTKLMNTLDLAAEYGFKILLDLHNYLRYKVGDVNELIGSVNVPGAAFIDVWKRIAELTKGHPALWAHGLMNEPYVKNPNWPALAQEAHDVIAAIDAKVYIVVSGDHWASASRWDSVNPDFPLVGDRIIYEAHTYLDSNSSGSYTDRNAEIPLMVGHTRLMNVVNWCEEHNVMLLIGELSIPHDMPQAIPALREQFKLLTAKNIPIFYWAGGRRWTASSANALQFQLTLREPITLLREFTNHSTRMIGPIR